MVCWLFWDEKLGGQRKLHFVYLHWPNCTGEERHAGVSNHLSEDFETHTRLSHVLYRNNSLCVHRLQVLHCMLVWDWQLCPPHCTVEYVQYVWVLNWTATSVWKRQKPRPCLHAQRAPFLAWTWFQVTKWKCRNSATVLHPFYTEDANSFDERVKTLLCTRPILLAALKVPCGVFDYC